MDDEKLQLAIVGRPNVGKSTLVNALVGDSNRLLTGPDPGLHAISYYLRLIYLPFSFFRSHS